MGKGVSIECKKCGYSATIFEGLGSINYELDNFIKTFNKEDKDFVNYILSKGTTEEIIYNNAYGKCNKCGDLATINYLKIRYDTDKIFTLENNCHHCEGIYKPISLEEVKISNCPVCNNKKFDSFTTMEWA